MSSEPPVPPPIPPPPPPPPTPPAVPASENRAIMIILAYFGLLALIPLLVEKEDKEVQWHAKHGLVLFVAEVALCIGLAIVSFALGAVSQGIAGCLFMLVWPLVVLGLLVLHILCIVKGLNGQRLVIPQLSSFADRF